MNSRQKFLIGGLLFCVLLLIITVSVRLRAPASKGAPPIEEASAIPGSGDKQAAAPGEGVKGEPAGESGEKPKAQAAEGQPASEPQSLAPSAEGPFVVLIDSFPNKEKAAARTDALKEAGFTGAFLAETTVTDGGELHTWYRVYLGHYADAKSATREAETLRKKRDIASYIVRKLQD